MKAILVLLAIITASLGLQAQEVDDLPLATLPQLGAGPALVIAVDRYSGDSAFADLPGIEHDWKGVKATLMRLGFKETDINVLVNPTQEEMLGAMNRFGEQAAATQKASFFYFTGHGVLLDGKNYLVPARAPIRVQGHLSTYAVPIEHVLGYLGGQDCGPSLVFVDACRDNSLPRTTKSASGPLTFHRQTGLFIGYATGEGRTSNASEDGSIFTASLCRRLLTPGRSVDDLYAGVIHDVQKATADEKVPQDPQKQSALRFVFHLVPQDNTVALGIAETEMQRRIDEEVKKRMAATVPMQRAAPSLADSPPQVVMTPSTTPAPSPPSGNSGGDLLVQETIDPSQGFHGFDAIYSGSAYAGYNLQSKELILKRAQKLLGETGMYIGEPDGAPGPKTHAAIKAWQIRRGIAATGLLNQETLVSLELAGISEMRILPAIGTRKPSTTRVPAKPSPEPPSGKAPSNTDEAYREAIKRMNKL